MHPVLAKLEAGFSPLVIESLHHDWLHAHGVHIDVLRADSIHPHISGNKWFKLKHNIEQCLQQQHDSLLTFGGPWSNHIHATAAATNAVGINCIGIIRGENVDNTNLEFAQSQGMQLHFIDRDSYRRKHEAEFIDQLHERFGKFYLVPEGGNNELACPGIHDMLEAARDSYEVICSAVGTGATLRGLIEASNSKTQVIGFSVLKDGGSLQASIAAELKGEYENWRVVDEYHFGGYARTTPTLFEFIKQFEADFGIALDAVYTAKMFYGLFDLVSKGEISAGSRILAIHTGGLQGNAGFARQLADCMNPASYQELFNP